MVTQIISAPNAALLPARMAFGFLGLAGAAGFLLHESGSLRFSGDLGCFALLLWAGAVGFWLTGSRHLRIRLDRSGLAFRYFPFQWRTRRVAWAQIRGLRVMPASELPPGAVAGRPVTDFSHWFFLTELRRGDVLCAELDNGTRLFFSLRDPGAVLEVLHHRQFSHLSTSFSIH